VGISRFLDAGPDSHPNKTIQQAADSLRLNLPSKTKHHHEAQRKPSPHSELETLLPWLSQMVGVYMENISWQKGT